MQWASYNVATLEEIRGRELIERAYRIFVCDPGNILVNPALLIRNKHCIDPRDKVYAILSLLPSGFSARIVPDYLRPSEEIFKEIVLHHISWSGQLNLLRFCRFKDPTWHLQLPSWVLNFSASSQLLEFPYFCSASGTSKQESLYQSSVDRLQICGRQICTIDKVFEAVPVGAKLTEVLAICQSWEAGW